MEVNKLRRLDEISRIMWVLFLVLWFSFAMIHTLTGAGCSQAAKTDIKNFFNSFKTCEQKASLGELAEPEAQLIKDVNSAIAGNISFDSQEWKTIGKNLGIKFGFDTIKCLASSLWQEIVNHKSVSDSDMGIKMGKKSLALKAGSEKYLQAVFETARE